MFTKHNRNKTKVGIREGKKMHLTTLSLPLRNVIQFRKLWDEVNKNLTNCLKHILTFISIFSLVTAIDSNKNCPLFRHSVQFSFTVCFLFFCVFRFSFSRRRLEQVVVTEKVDTRSLTGLPAFSTVDCSVGKGKGWN